MTPILFEADATTFTTNGIGRLPDALQCTVAEERNGPYELYLEYPITGQYFSELLISRIICAPPAPGKEVQPFRIYRISKPLNGVCGIYAEHISYELNSIPVMPYTAGSCAEALTKAVQNAGQTCPFTVWTDKTVTAPFELDTPIEFRALLGGTQGSILDVYGKGEYEFDKWQIKLYVNRGVNSGASIRYGKNMTELLSDEDVTTTITGVCPYWQDLNSGTVVTLPEVAVWSPTYANFPYKRTAVIDFTADFETQPTEAQLRARANKYITDNDIGIPKKTITVSFNTEGTVSSGTLNLEGAEWVVEYEDYLVLERINLCDTVSVVYGDLGVSATAKVVKATYNVLEDRYDSLEIGDAQTKLSDTIATREEVSAVYTQMDKETSMLQGYVDHQTELITGGLGGYVVMNLNANGQPEEILIMDSSDMATAVNVIRMNKNGIGFSTTGYAGPFTSAWTIDGHFNADFITTGTLSANIVRGGLLTDATGNNYWNLQSGNMSLTGLFDSTATLNGATTHSSIGTFSYTRPTWSVGSGITGTTTETDVGFGVYLDGQMTNENSIKTMIGKGNHYRVCTSLFPSGETNQFTDIVRTKFSNGANSFYNFIQWGWGYRSYGMTNAPGGYSAHAMYVFGYDTFGFHYGSQVSSTSANVIGKTGISVNDSEVGISSLNGGYVQINNGYLKINNNGFILSYKYSNNDIELKGNGLNLTWRGNPVQVSSSSSRRYKHDIEPLSEDLDPHKLLKLEAKQFVYNDGHRLQYEDMKGQTLPGFIAEDVEEIYPSAVIHDDDGKPESWDERRIIPGMLALIQEQQKKIDELAARLTRLEKRMEVEP